MNPKTILFRLTCLLALCCSGLAAQAQTDDDIMKKLLEQSGHGYDYEKMKIMMEAAGVLGEGRMPTDEELARMNGKYDSLKRVTASATLAVLDGHPSIDLGLSVRWATCNVGATQPGQTGGYYAWGEVAEKNRYDTTNSLTYDRRYEDIEANRELDVAAREWGGKWRMPTYEEMEELIENCTFDEYREGDVVCQKVTGPNGNVILLPLSGYASGINIGRGYAELGYYWSSTPDKRPDENDPYNWSAYALPVKDKKMMSPDICMEDYSRYVGMQVRPVYGEKKPAQQPAHTKRPEWQPKPSGTKIGHQYVDLGLSVKWALCNVGADEPQAYGDYYAWGETQPKDKKAYVRETAKNYHKEISDFAGQRQLDVATAQWGASWRMPTAAECRELLTQCKFRLSKVKDVWGTEITGPNGNSIFIPFAGHYNHSFVYGEDWSVNEWAERAVALWSSTPHAKNETTFAESIRIIGDEMARGAKLKIYTCDRHYGLSVRPVTK